MSEPIVIRDPARPEVAVTVKPCPWSLGDVVVDGTEWPGDRKPLVIVGTAVQCWLTRPKWRVCVAHWAPHHTSWETVIWRDADDVLPYEGAP
jgi:hypothetical protein